MDMPLYEYYCSDCQMKFELLVGHEQADDVVCVKCQSEHVRRLLSIFSAKRNGGENSSLGSKPSMGGGGCCGGACGCH
jgi:putative FmdB family regulatory protein